MTCKDCPSPTNIPCDGLEFLNDEPGVGAELRSVTENMSQNFEISNKKTQFRQHTEEIKMLFQRCLYYIYHINLLVMVVLKNEYFCTLSKRETFLTYLRTNL